MRHLEVVRYDPHLMSSLALAAALRSSARSERLVLPTTLSRIDRAILERAFGDWHGGTFADALARLVSATERVIPAGRVYLLGRAADAPVIGSLISGVGLMEDALGLAIVRVAPADARPLEPSLIHRLAG